MVKFCTGVAHDKTISQVAHDNTISQTKQNFEICPDIIDNEVILLKLEHFHRKALNFKKLYLNSLQMKHGKNL